MALIAFKKLNVITCVSTAILFAGYSTQTLAMTPFQANYQFAYNGKNLGSATRTLSKSGDDWTYVFAAKAGTIASATETSRFSLNNGQITSGNFTRTSKILVHNNTMSIKFNPSAKLVAFALSNTFVSSTFTREGAKRRVVSFRFAETTTPSKETASSSV